MLKRDFRYILKRIIVGVSIALILSLLSNNRVKAGELNLVEGYAFASTSQCLSPDYNTFAYTPNAFNSYGKGFIYFTFHYQASKNPNTGRPITEVKVRNSNGSWFICDIGDLGMWADNSQQDWTITAKCPVDLSNSSLNRIEITTNPHNQSSCVNLSKIMNFVSEGNYSSQLNSVISNLQYLQSINSQQTGELQAVNQHLNDLVSALVQNKQEVEQINDAIQSDNIDNNAVTDNTQGWEQQTSYVPTGSSGGTITDLLTLPIKLIQGFVNGLNSSCVPFNLGNLYGTDLILPCINISSFIGMPLWTTIDILFSGFMILHIGKKFVKIFNDFTNLRSNQMDDLYGGGN